MIETHAHLYDDQFKEDIEAVINRAKEQGVECIYMPNCDSTTIEPMMQLVHKFPGYCIPMMGVHPCYIKEDYEKELAIAFEQLQSNKFAAIGEIGLDYHWDLTFVEQQKKAFAMQIDWAIKMNLPIVIHSRNATQDCIDIVKSKQNGTLRGIFHCFGDDLGIAQQIIDLGFKLGIGGVLTFKNSGLVEVIKEIDIKHLVLETDAPYLAPVPKRGKRNETSYLSYIKSHLALTKNITEAAVEVITTNNAKEVFGENA
ncbi:MAG TPA: TatD family hydrolase [Edaphocola sp.]|nr:TatD family hydrolase [Edaphocola sp.]